MKKISYMLVLFISLFVVSGVVKANVTCTYERDTVYEFSDDGRPISKTSPTPILKNKEVGVLDTYFEEYSTESQKIIVKNGEPICPRSTDYYVEGTGSDNKYILKYKDYGSTIERSVDVDGCSGYETYDGCTTSSKFSCVWVDRDSGKIINDSTVSRTDAYCNVDNLQYVQCGNSFDIPTYVPKITSFVINLLKILTPIILVFTSAITLLKAITANKEDEMNKAKTTLVRRIGIAALIFFTITITQFVINKVAEPEEADELGRCFNCFINNSCEGNTYYKNNINGEYQCFYTNDINKTEPFKGECH